MKCGDFERDIYLYSELSEPERMRVDVHIQKCDACKEIFQHVSSTHGLLAQAAIKKPEVVNHARLTSNIMQAVANPQKQSTLWINNLFLKYTMVAASFALIIVFGAEQVLPVEPPQKYVPIVKTVTLNSTDHMKATRERKEKRETEKTSLYVCVRTGGCDNRVLSNLKQKKI